MTKIIYILIDPRNGDVRYVGRTSDIIKRMSKHYSVTTAVGTFKHEFVVELAAEGLRVDYEIIDEVPEEEGKFWETFYTDLFRSWGFDLLNNRYYKMGNQTSFQPGVGNRPVVAVTKSGSVHASYESIKLAAATVGVQPTSLSQSLLRYKKVIGGFIWFYKEDFETISKEEFNKILEWANRCDIKANSGSFKKGQSPHNKVEISDELAVRILADYIPREFTQRDLSKKYGLGENVIRRALDIATKLKLAA